MKQRGPLMGLELTTDKYPPITSQTRYPPHILKSIHYDRLYPDIICSILQGMYIGPGYNGNEIPKWCIFFFV